MTAAEKAGSNMRTIEKIKSTLKEALRTKRIRDETPTVETPTQNFNEFTKLLTPQEWKLFEEQEQWFRYVTGDNCDQRIYIHSNPESWWKLVKVLNEQFFVNGVFQKTKRNGLEWKEAFIKYVCRVLKSFPIPNLNSTQNDLSNKVMLEEIERKLRWIKSEIQPDFSRRIKKTNGVREVTQEKLTDLWNTNRVRAIAIIKDDCKIRPQECCSIQVSDLQQYCESKCKSKLESEFTQETP